LAQVIFAIEILRARDFRDAFFVLQLHLAHVTFTPGRGMRFEVRIRCQLRADVNGSSRRFPDID
jgi:hypothetical protein